MTDNDDFKTNQAMADAYNWIFTDIVGASDPTISTIEQAKKIAILNDFVKKTRIFGESAGSRIEFSTGDGFVIGFKDHPEKPFLLAIELHKAIFGYNKSVSDKDKINIRIGIDTGLVYFVEDLEGRPSPWGPGVVNARRVMDIGEKMHILANSKIAEDVSRLTSDYAKIMHQIGDYGIKHGGRLLLYNIYGDGFGNETKPLDTESPGIDPTRRFHFTNIVVRNDVTDPKTMMTHHTWLWELKNVTLEPIDKVFYYLDGDVPKRIADLNIKITDEKGNQLKITSVERNEEKHKAFIVQTKTPLMPNEERRSLKLEYDWEESDRNFFFRLASKCKEFKFVFTISSEAEIKSRMFQVDPEVDARIFVSPPPTISFHDDRTEVTWQASNLQKFDAYEFKW